MQPKNARLLCSAAELDLVKTFECGQCFRWNADENGVYAGVAFDRAARLWEENGAIYIDAPEDEVDKIWRDYFDLNTGYERIRAGFDAGEYLDRCADFGAGIRILRQAPWEVLCSFIISQCNNIPRIKKIVEALCALAGEPIRDHERGEVYYTFPSAETVAGLEVSDLAPLRCGYRAPYIINAARAVASREPDLKALSACGCDEALEALKTLAGVGDKVANCVILFGLHIMSAFPIDVWMKRALKENFPKDFDPGSLGEYAGLAQQYIFFYARSNGAEKGMDRSRDAELSL